MIPRTMRILMSLLVVLSAAGFESGCREKQADKSLPQSQPPQAPASPPTVTSQIEPPKPSPSAADAKDLTPMGYLATVIRSQDRGKLAKSLENLHSLAQAVEMYRVQANAYPPSLEVLIQQGYTPEAAARSPGDATRPILYLPPSDRPGAEDVLAFDPVNYVNNRYAVLLVGGGAVEMDIEDLKARLSRQGVK